MSTREKILDTALALFNKEGTAAISTNHIAEAAGISPGNLYYHFRNKEEVIRELFERLSAANNATSRPVASSINTNTLPASSRPSNPSCGEPSICASSPKQARRSRS